MTDRVGDGAADGIETDGDEDGEIAKRSGVVAGVGKGEETMLERTEAGVEAIKAADMTEADWLGEGAVVAGNVSEDEIVNEAIDAGEREQKKIPQASKREPTETTGDTLARRQGQ